MPAMHATFNLNFPPTYNHALIPSAIEQISTLVPVYSTTGIIELLLHVFHSTDSLSDNIADIFRLSRPLYLLAVDCWSGCVG